MEKCEQGYKLKDGKCVKVNNPSYKKKINSPFKMWGSWVGAILFPLLIGITDLTDRFISLRKILAPKIFCIPTQAGATFFDGTGICIDFLIIQLIVGFLIGWGIQTLIIKYKK